MTDTDLMRLLSLPDAAALAEWRRANGLDRQGNPTTKGIYEVSRDGRSWLVRYDPRHADKVHYYWLPVLWSSRAHLEQSGMVWIRRIAPIAGEWEGLEC